MQQNRMEQVQCLACARAVLLGIGLHVLGGCASASKPEVKSVAAMAEHRASAARPESDSAGQRFKECPGCPEMVVLPAGTFTMGAPQSEASRDDEGPQHPVTIERPFAIGVAAVTRGEYGMFVRETHARTGDGCYVLAAGGGDAEKRADASWLDPGMNQTDRDPVVCVSWEDAMAYVVWINGKVTSRAREEGPYRLPTEAEWEYAAHAGTTTRYWWGDSAGSVCRYANGADLAAQRANPEWTAAECDDGYVSTSPSGTFVANGFGLYDMAGNVSQWIEDCYHDDYAGAPDDGSAWTSGACDRRVVRGGSWHSAPGDLRVARRGGFPSDLRSDAVGFRVVRTVDYRPGANTVLQGQ